jgi:Glyoxalase superfamily protein
MRDFRDAKAMAQTLRESFSARSVSLTVSESLEIIAKLFGFSDWNVLAAKIRAADQTSSGIDASGRSDDAAQASSKPEEVVLDGAVLDRYVGTYQFHRAVATVTRSESHLLVGMTRHRGFAYHATSDTEFFTKDHDARLNFKLGPDGVANVLVFKQGGADHILPRIDTAAAQALEREIESRISSRSAIPGSEAALRRLVDGIRSGLPNYAEMSAQLAEVTRKQLPRLHRHLSELGPIKSVDFLGVGTLGQDVYSVWHEAGASHWQINLDGDGTVYMALVTAGP